MKVKKALLVALSLLLVFTMTACGGGAGDTSAPSPNSANTTENNTGGADFDPSQYPVAVAMESMNHPVHRIVQLGFLKAAEQLGYTNAKVIGTEGGDVSETMAACEAFAAEGGKGLLMFAGDSSSHETVASMAAQGVTVGIPHFSHMQEDGEYPEGLAFNMACNPVLYGRQVAELMAEKLDGKSGSIAITQNTKNVTENAAADSFIATWESLGDQYSLSNITVLPVELEGAQVDSATAINLAIIQSHSDLIGAFGTTGNSPATWADAASKAGKNDGEILIVGMDATEANLDYLESGKVLAIVAQPLYEEAYKTMEYLDIIFRGGTVDIWTDLEAPIVTVDGNDKNGIEYHRAIAKEVEEFFK